MSETYVGGRKFFFFLLIITYFGLLTLKGIPSGENIKDTRDRSSEEQYFSLQLRSFSKQWNILVILCKISQFQATPSQSSAANNLHCTQCIGNLETIWVTFIHSITHLSMWPNLETIWEHPRRIPFYHLLPSTRGERYVIFTYRIL